MTAFFTFFGRICISAIFIFAGIGKLMDYEATAAYMEGIGMTNIPFFLYMAAIIELVGGLSLFLGFMTRWGALLLALFLIPVTFMFHNFWAYTGIEQQQQMIHFFSNLAIFGGLLFVFSHGAGSLSIDARRYPTHV